MRNAFVSTLCALMLTVEASGTGHAQSAKPAMPTVPTTRILAIGTIRAGSDPKQVLSILPEEVRQTVDLYLDGKIDQWYSLQEGQGVVFVLNVTDKAAAHEMLEK